ncbi:MAG: hypothetical protein IPN79_06240 [Saprospiraceae bacterium]|nr:hypothetical protein [Saprospiraceae bacterium]
MDIALLIIAVSLTTEIWCNSVINREGSPRLSYNPNLVGCFFQPGHCRIKVCRFAGSFADKERMALQNCILDSIGLSEMRYALENIKT